MIVTDPVLIAQKTLLEPAALSEQHLAKVLNTLLGTRIDWADLYFQEIHSESWALEDGIIKEASYDIGRGVGVRAISGEKTGFAYSDDIILPALEQAATAARSIAAADQVGRVRVAPVMRGHALYPITTPFQSLDEAGRVALLQTIDQEARRQDPRVTHVSVSLGGSYEVVLIFNSLGQLAADIRPLVRLNVSVIVEENGRRERAGAGGGLRGDYRYFLEEDRGLQFAREAVRQALVALEAVPAPAGAMAVVLGPGWPGVLLHEAVGHGLEGDFIRRGTSAFTGRIGERVAAPGCTVIDDGTLPERRGSLNIDDEGVLTRCTVLIEDGILKGFMQDRLNARLMGAALTGNGRRESYACLPLPRMTNTYMLPGKYDPQEIIASVNKGIYAVNFAGGQVDITSGKFVFSASEAYLIENGKITQPIKGATFVGDGPDVLTKVSMIGNDLKLDDGVGTCGKEGQSVPVGVGQPTLKINEMTLGGTQI